MIAVGPLDVTMPVPITLPSDTLASLMAEGFTHFGAHAGHVVAARPAEPKKVLRLHCSITGAPEAYRPLYRDGDASNLARENLGFLTKGNYPWWLVPRDGEHDPAWNREGLLMRHPKAITTTRDVILSPPPALTPTPHKTDRRLEQEHWWKPRVKADGRTPLDR